MKMNSRRLRSDQTCFGSGLILVLFDTEFDNNRQISVVMTFTNNQQAEVEQLLETAKARAFGTGDGGNAPDTLQLADLFNLCSAQIKKYEYQTQTVHIGLSFLQ